MLCYTQQPAFKLTGRWKNTFTCLHSTGLNCIPPVPKPPAYGIFYGTWIIFWSLLKNLWAKEDRQEIDFVDGYSQDPEQLDLVHWINYLHKEETKKKKTKKKKKSLLMVRTPFVLCCCKWSHPYGASRSSANKSSFIIAHLGMVNSEKYNRSFQKVLFWVSSLTNSLKVRLDFASKVNLVSARMQI